MGIKEKIESEFSKQKESIEKPNLMIVGGTGVGKSSLINRIFGKDLAAVGAGKPVTSGIHKYERESIPLVIYDTEGYEISDGEANSSNFYQVIIPKVKEMQQKELKDQIHLVWYCISVNKHRITSFDIENIKYLINELNLKCAIVFTQCDKDPLTPEGKGKNAEAYRQVLNDHGINAPTFETCAANADLPLDLDELVEWSSEALENEALRRSFIAAQRHSVKLKKKSAYGIVAGFTASTAATAAANPFPLSDSALLVPQQIAMSVSISKVFGFEALGSQIVTLLKAQLLSIVGRQLAASLTKLIPFVGQVVNATVAASITGGLGVALIEIYSKAYIDYLEKGKVPNWEVLFDNFGEVLQDAILNWKEK